MIGIALLGMGALLLWAAVTGRADAVMEALRLDLRAPDLTLPDWLGGGGTGSGGGGSGSTGGGGGGGQDSGSHQGIDSSGNVITIDKNYGDMSDAEKDAANKYAHEIGNLGSGAAP